MIISCVLNCTTSRSTLPSNLCGMVKWVPAFGLSNNGGDGERCLLAAYRRANGSSPWAWCKGRRPSGAVLHSSREPVVRRPCSDFTDMLRRLINCRIIIIITIIVSRWSSSWRTIQYWRDIGHRDTSRPTGQITPCLLPTERHGDGQRSMLWGNN